MRPPQPLACCPFGVDASLVRSHSVHFKLQSAYECWLEFEAN